ncbi:FMN-binding protein [Kitasatospora sp. NPDC127111]|uniref:FMN-binding protein n=1 Tax=Kitasatospora sp. NPDC127111 TaxID=3345363 RepID=UPI00362E4E07
MRRAVVSCTATAAGVILLLSLKPHDGGAVQASTGTTRASAGAASAPPAASASGSSTRTVTGDAVPTRYGPVQVRITLDGTKLTKVEAVQYPTGDRRDREINAGAIPVLGEEALAAQSADIDVVSGATYTSDGYAGSLQSALDKAGR